MLVLKNRFRFQLENSIEEVHEAILRSLPNQGYEIQEDSKGLIVAEHKFSFKYPYASHILTVTMDSPGGRNTNVALDLDKGQNDTFMIVFRDDLVRNMRPVPR